MFNVCFVIYEELYKQESTVTLQTFHLVDCLDLTTTSATEEPVTTVTAAGKQGGTILYFFENFYLLAASFDVLKDNLKSCFDFGSKTQARGTFKIFNF